MEFMKSLSRSEFLYNHKFANQFTTTLTRALKLHTRFNGNKYRPTTFGKTSPSLLSCAFVGVTCPEAYERVRLQQPTRFRELTKLKPLTSPLPNFCAKQRGTLVDEHDITNDPITKYTTFQEYLAIFKAIRARCHPTILNMSLYKLIAFTKSVMMMPKYGISLKYQRSIQNQNLLLLRNCSISISKEDAALGFVTVKKLDRKFQIPKVILGYSEILYLDYRVKVPSHVVTCSNIAQKAHLVERHLVNINRVIATDFASHCSSLGMFTDNRYLYETNMAAFHRTGLAHLHALSLKYSQFPSLIPAIQRAAIIASNQRVKGSDRFVSMKQPSFILKVIDLLKTSNPSLAPHILSEGRTCIESLITRFFVVPPQVVAVIFQLIRPGTQNISIAHANLIFSPTKQMGGYLSYNPRVVRVARSQWHYSA